MTIEIEDAARPWTNTMSEGSDRHDRLPKAEGIYEWRIPLQKDPTRRIAFLAKMRRRGAGFTQVISPEFDQWDGYRVLLPRNVEWREAEADAADLLGRRSYLTLGIEGLEPEPCPFCHGTPRFEGRMELMISGSLFDERPYQNNSWKLTCCSWTNSPAYADPAVLVQKRRDLLTGAPKPTTPSPTTPPSPGTPTGPSTGPVRYVEIEKGVFVTEDDYRKDPRGCLEVCRQVSDGASNDTTVGTPADGPLRSGPPQFAQDKVAIPIIGTKITEQDIPMQITLTLASITTGTISKGPSMGQKFTTSKGATAHFGNGDKPVTVMAFGAQRESVAKLLRKGKKVTVTAVWDGKNVIKILGPRQAAPAPAAESAEG